MSGDAERKAVTLKPENHRAILATIGGCFALPMIYFGVRAVALFWAGVFSALSSNIYTLPFGPF